MNYCVYVYSNVVYKCICSQNKTNEVNNMYLITFIKVIKWNWLHYKNRINAIDKNIVGFEIVISYNLE